MPEKKRSGRRVAVGAMGMLFLVSAVAGRPSAARVVPPPAGMQCAVLPQLFNGFLNGHYLHKSITDEIRAHTLEQLIKSMDPSKTMLLKSDVSQLRSQTGAIFAGLENGDCSLIEKAYATLSARAQEN